MASIKDIYTHGTRLMLLRQATNALHELLKDESIHHVTFEAIELAQTGLMAAYDSLERWEARTKPGALNV